jgi:hypothetical protein
LESRFTVPNKKKGNVTSVSLLLRHAAVQSVQDLPGHPEPFGWRTKAGPDRNSTQKNTDYPADKARDMPRMQVQRHAADGSNPARVAPMVHEILHSPGRPLDARTRASIEPRFGHDFSSVRVHTDNRAAQSAQAINSLAYTVGRNIVFAPGTYLPASAEGQRLIAHELVHVIQQPAAPDAPTEGNLTLGQPDSAQEFEARRVAAEVIHKPVSVVSKTRDGSCDFPLLRADPDAVGQIFKLRTVVGAGIQFIPVNVADTRIGPVTAKPGQLSSGASRLNVIIGRNLTPRILAREILPLWTTATPFAPPGGGPSVGPGALDELQLAQGLLVYNQYYLPVPGMTKWQAGLRFPLPVDIDELTGIATVNTDVIRSLAGAFDPAWMPALDQRAASTAAQPIAAVRADVAAFLAAEPTTTGRGITLGARAITNAQASQPFIREAFTQLGADAFDVALVFMDELVNRDIGLLAAQQDGAAILAAIRTALGAPPAGISPDRQTRLDRANAMLARVAGVAAANPSAAVPTRAEKAVTVDTVKLDGSTINPSTSVQIASAIYAQCNVRVNQGVDAAATNAQTTGWLGADRQLAVAPSCGTVSGEERTLYRGAAAAFGLGARFHAFFVLDMTGYNASGYSLPPYCATGAAAPFRNTIVVANSGDDSTLAHEMGHILLNSGKHPANTIMAPRPRPNEITDEQSNTIYTNA